MSSASSHGAGRRLVRAGGLGLLGLTAIIVGYLMVTFAQVWWASRQDHARHAQAIVVLGAAQYDGRPSPVLKARLDHAEELWRRGLAATIVVTGGRQPGDRFTEAGASADYLLARGVPNSDILREVTGRRTWSSLAASARFLRARGINDVVLVSDPFHSLRLQAISAELGWRSNVSPTHTSPIVGVSELPYLARETLAVAAGRIIGFRRLVGLEQRAPVPVAEVSVGQPPVVGVFVGYRLAPLLPCAATHSGVV